MGYDKGKLHMKNVIFMINIVKDDRSRNQGYDYSIKSWQQYAKKYDCELFVLNELVADLEYMTPHWTKMYILDILDANEIEYDQVLYVDSDTIITPNAPNIFDISEHKFCAVPNFGDKDWMIRSMENYSYELFDNFKFPYFNYFNSGVMVFNKSHKEFFKSIQQFYETNRSKIVWMQKHYGVGHDQPIFNFFVNKELTDEYKVLGYEWNMQDLNRSELLGNDFMFTRYGYVCHFNCGIKPTPGAWIQATYEYLY